MKRLFSLFAVVTFLLVNAAMPASAAEVPGHSSAFGGSALDWQQQYLGWLFGSETNPLMQSDFCGETVGNAFLLNAAINPVTEVTCTIPTGTRLVGSPGGSISWSPTDATTDTGLLAARDEFISHITDTAATLDGHPLEVQSGYAASDVYTIPLAPDSFVKTVDPNTAGLTETRVASAAWIIRIHPLPPGSHTLVLSDKIDGVSYTATFHLTVQPGRSN
jgi:hypothetical protein